MTKVLNLEDIDESVRNKVYLQNYDKHEYIEGVKIIELVNYINEDGDFSEILRLNSVGEVEQIPGFKLAQINRTMLNPQSIKAWHLHFKQDEIFYIAPIFGLFVGLWDVRKNSPTAGKIMRIALGSGQSHLLYVPRGIAHGNANFTFEPIQLYYLTNNLFNPQTPDEHRIKWDALGTEFWKPQRD